MADQVEKYRFRNVLTSASPGLAASVQPLNKQSNTKASKPRRKHGLLADLVTEALLLDTQQVEQTVQIIHAVVIDLNTPFFLCMVN